MFWGFKLVYLGDIMKLILKIRIRFLDCSSITGLCGEGRFFGVGEYEVEFIQPPHPSFSGKWVLISGSKWGVALKYLEQWKHLGDRGPVRLIYGSLKEYIGKKIIVEEMKKKNGNGQV